jgi:hypothetical protein
MPVPFGYESLEHRTVLGRSKRFRSECLHMKSNSRAHVGKRILVAISLAKNCPSGDPQGIGDIPIRMLLYDQLQMRWHTRDTRRTAVTAQAAPLSRKRLVKSPPVDRLLRPTQEISCDRGTGILPKPHAKLRGGTQRYGFKVCSLCGRIPLFSCSSPQLINRARRSDSLKPLPLLASAYLCAMPRTAGEKEFRTDFLGS